MSPSTMKQWTVEGKSGFDSLKYNESAKVPEVGETDVLVKCMTSFTPVQSRKY
jgi:hypothetical protein